MEKTLTGFGPGVNRYSRLPAEGWSDPQVKAELGRLNEMEHTRWEDGRVSGAVYHGGQELVDVQVEAYKMFTVANPIHPDVFPGVRKMEAEVVAMVRSTHHLRCCDKLTLKGSIHIQCPSWRSRRHNVRWFVAIITSDVAAS